jgi:histidinol-phosphate aminotransferase
VYELNEKIRDLVPYEPIDGDYPIRLDANESFLSLPEELRTGRV